MAEKYFEKIDVFEQRSYVGGVWNYGSSSAKIGVSTTVPQLSPHEPVETPIWDQPRETEGSPKPSFVSPLYERLETNIPKELMCYSDKPFPSDSQLFPKHGTVQQYLEEYAEEIKSFIQFATQVVDVRLKNSTLSTWDVSTRDLHTDTETTHSYDAVVVANGHYTVPYLPDIPGIETWDRSYPGVISHSKFYDSPEPFRGKKAVVVGNSASGIDIGAQINQMSKGPVFVSQRSESFLGVSGADKVTCPEIVEFLPPTSHDRGIRFANGHIEEYIDAIVFCTGYFYSYPFLSSLKPPVVTHGRRAMNIYQQLFYIDHPTLVFPVLAQRVIPFPMAENQAAVFSRVWSGRLALPPKSDMRAWEDTEVAVKGDGKVFHLLPFPMDADYLNLLYDWATRAELRPGFANNGNGKLGIRWGERERWMRSLFPDIRRAFAQKGEQRGKVKSLEDLGFVFQSECICDQFCHASCT